MQNINGKRTVLLAQAAAEISSVLRSGLDLGQMQAEGRAFMAEVGTAFGLGPMEGQREYDRAYPEWKRDLLARLDQMAQEKIEEAKQAAEAECQAHIDRLRDLRQIHQGLLVQLAERQKTAIPVDADEVFASLIRSSYEDTMRHVQATHRFFMDAVREQHLRKLVVCFAKHLVTEATAKKLADLYEVRE